MGHQDVEAEIAVRFRLARCWALVRRAGSSGGTHFRLLAEAGLVEPDMLALEEGGCPLDPVDRDHTCAADAHHVDV
jgi:hypothetical protein